MTGSIRGRTLLLVLGVLSLSLSLMSWRSYRDAQHEIEELFDAQLAQTARLLEGLVARDISAQTGRALQQALDQAATAVHGGHGEAAQPLGHRYESKLAFVVYDETGRRLLHSASAPESALARLIGQAPADGAGFGAAAKAGIGYHNLTLDGREWRVFLLHDRQDGRWILVGEREDVRGELVTKIARRSLLPDLIGLPLLALLVWGAVGWGLRPLVRMVESLRRRDPDTLSPLPDAPLPRELQPVAASLNQLLAQVTDLLAREKRFLADAAHELRTPLAVLRIHTENALEASDAQDRDVALLQLRSGIDRATRVVTQLLTLARLEPSAAPLNRSEQDLLPLLRNEVAELTPLALAKQQDLMLDADDAADYRLPVDTGSLGILVQNLVSNAVQYTPVGGQIRVRLLREASGVWLSVADSGPGVPTEQRQKLFDRFYREGAGKGAGLGLSIVARIVELHRGRIRLEDSDLGGLDVRVWLPLALAPGYARLGVPGVDQH